MRDDIPRAPRVAEPTQGVRAEGTGPAVHGVCCAGRPADHAVGPLLTALCPSSCRKLCCVVRCAARRSRRTALRVRIKRDASSPRAMTRFSCIRLSHATAIRASASRNARPAATVAPRDSIALSLPRWMRRVCQMPSAHLKRRSATMCVAKAAVTVVETLAQSESQPLRSSRRRPIV